MADQTYKVIYTGKLNKHIAPAAILQNLAGVFSADTSRVRQVFNARGAVVFVTNDSRQAQRCALEIKKAGALCTVEPEATAQTHPDIPSAGEADTATTKTTEAKSVGMMAGAAMALTDLERLADEAATLATETDESDIDETDIDETDIAGPDAYHTDEEDADGLQMETEETDSQNELPVYEMGFGDIEEEEATQYEGTETILDPFAAGTRPEAEAPEDWDTQDMDDTGDGEAEPHRAFDQTVAAMDAADLTDNTTSDTPDDTDNTEDTASDTGDWDAAPEQGGQAGEDGEDAGFSSGFTMGLDEVEQVEPSSFDETAPGTDLSATVPFDSHDDTDEMVADSGISHALSDGFDETVAASDTHGWDAAPEQGGQTGEDDEDAGFSSGFTMGLDEVEQVEPSSFDETAPGTDLSATAPFDTMQNAPSKSESVFDLGADTQSAPEAQDDLSDHEHPRIDPFTHAEDDGTIGNDIWVHDKHEDAFALNAVPPAQDLKHVDSEAEAEAADDNTSQEEPETSAFSSKKPATDSAFDLDLDDISLAGMAKASKPTEIERTDKGIWSRNYCLLGAAMLLAGFFAPLIKQSMLYASTVTIWPWNLMGFGLNAERAAALVSLMTADMSLTWLFTPLIGAIAAFSICVIPSTKARAAAMVTTGYALFALLLIYYHAHNEIFGIVFLPPTIEGGTMVMVFVSFIMLIAASNHARKYSPQAAVPRVLMGAAGMLTVALSVYPVIASGFTNLSSVIIDAFLLIIAIYGLLAVTSAIVPGTQGRLAPVLSAMAKAFVLITPVACLASQITGTDDFARYIIGKGGGFAHHIAAYLKCFLILYGLTFIWGAGLAELLKYDDARQPKSLEPRAKQGRRQSNKPQKK